MKYLSRLTSRALFALLWALFISIGVTAKAVTWIGSDLTADEHNSRGVAIGDLNHDGRPDVVIGNQNGQNSRVYLNNGTNDPFSGVVGSDLNGGGLETIAVALGDFNGDGDADVVTANYISGQNYIYFGDGTGTAWTEFALPSDGHASHGVAVADLDLDGDIDIVFANIGNEVNRVYLNDGTGTGWTGLDLTSDAHASTSVAIGLLNADAYPDIVIGNADQEVERAYINDGTGMGWTGYDVTSDTRTTADVTIGDVDGDGDADIIAANGVVAGTAQRNRVYLNDGTGTGWSGSDLTTDEQDSQSVALGDIDRDGDLDVVIGNQTGSGDVNRLYINDGTGLGWTRSDITSDAQVTSEMRLADLDRDGDLDAVAANYNSANRNRVYLNATPLPRSRYKLDEGTGSLAGDSSGSYDGTVAGATWASHESSRQSCSALIFGASGDGVSLPSNTINDLPAGAFVCWVYPTGNFNSGPSTGNSQYYIVSKQDAGVIALFDVWLDFDGRIQTNIGGSDTYGGSNALVPLNQWTHIAITWDGTDKRVYINGQLDSSGGTASVSDSPQTTFIGRNVTHVDDRFIGRIDDVHIYDQALSEGSVRNLFAPCDRITEIYTAGADSSDYTAYCKDVSQTFTIGAVGPNTDQHLSAVILQLFRVGQPGTCQAELYELPDEGTVVSRAFFDGDRLTTDPNGEWVHLPMPPFRLKMGKAYRLRLEVGAGVGQPNEQLHWILDSADGGYSGGEAFKLGCSIAPPFTWIPLGDADFQFQICTQNAPPECSAGGPYVAECQGGTTSLQLDGSSSSDPEGTTLVYSWSSDCPGILFDDPSSPTPTITIDSSMVPVNCEVTLAVSDGIDTCVCSATVTVRDTTPPQVACHVPCPFLWPPDRHLVNVGLQTTVSDACDSGAASSKTIEVWSDEPAALGLTPDATLTGGILKLRAERNPFGNGRVYLVIVRATDHSGNSSSSCCAVVLPRLGNIWSWISAACQAAQAKQYCMSHGGSAPPGFTRVLP